MAFDSAELFSNIFSILFLFIYTSNLKVTKYSKVTKFYIWILYFFSFLCISKLTKERLDCDNSK